MVPVIQQPIYYCYSTVRSYKLRISIINHIRTVSSNSGHYLSFNLDCQSYWIWLIAYVSKYLCYVDIFCVHIYLWTLFEIIECSLPISRTFNFSTIAALNMHWPLLLFLKYFFFRLIQQLRTRWPFALLLPLLFLTSLNMKRSWSCSVLLWTNIVRMQKKEF